MSTVALAIKETTPAVKNKGFNMTPREIVAELDKYIIGQDDAKRAVAIALRNRWRRMQLPVELRQEITPKNILMIGPTGVGKTEIARRLSTLADAPFVKVEATKFTEVGYVGRDVEQIIRDLTEISIKRTREKAIRKFNAKAAEAAEERVLDILVPPSKSRKNQTEEEKAESDSKESATRQLFRKRLQNKELDDKEIEIQLSSLSGEFNIMAPPGMEEMVGQLHSMMEAIASKSNKPKRLKVKDALRRIQEEEAAKLINEDEIKQEAIDSVEQNGIVFLDEMDKIVRRAEVRGADVSREGVQRDLLPLVEGSTVSTKYGMVKTDHVLFIGSGAFHLSKPSDLIPELQGRFPIRVELKALTTEDFTRILTEPKASLTEQYVELLKTENFNIKFKTDGIKRLAEIAFQVNDNSENIGARRLHTILERLLDKISFDASDNPGKSVVINKTYVNEQLQKLAEDEDLSRYIL